MAVDDNTKKQTDEVGKEALLATTDASGTNNKAEFAEKQGLLNGDGVKVTPASQDEPIDKFNLVYLIMMLHGVGTLMPWNMFITANAYFVDYKLASHGNSTDAAMYRDYFLSTLGFWAQIPNVILNGMNLFCHCGGGGDIARRIVWSIIIVVVMFIITVVLAMVDSSEWPAAFYWVTMATVVVINMANGVYQNSVYGTAACLPMKYTNAVVLGSNISGTLTSVLSVVSIAMSPNPRTAAIYYFLTAIFVLLVAFDTYFALPMLKFFRYHRNKAKRQQELSAVDEVMDRPPFWEIFKKCWVQDLSVFWVFFVTLTCFPAIQANVAKSSDSFLIPEKYYTGVTCFLFFNAFAMIGNLVTEFIKVPGPRYVWIPVVLRTFFIPFFMFCNFRPDKRALPVLISNDYIYMFGGIIMAFTSGYFSSLTMMYAPGNVEPQHQGTAGMMAAFFLILGIFLGVLFSLPVIVFIENVG